MMTTAYGVIGTGLMQMGSSRWETLVCLKMCTYPGTSDWTRNLEESNCHSSGWLQKAFKMDCSMKKPTW